MENALQAHPDLCAVYAATDGLLPPIYSAAQKVDRYKKIGEEGHIIVLSIDGDPQGYSNVKEGYMDAGYATDQGAMAQMSLEAIMTLNAGEEIPEDEQIVFLPGIEYMPENLDEVKDSVWGSAGDKPGAGLTIFVAMDKMNAFREGQQKFWEMAADELGVEMILQVAGEDAQRQSSQIDTAIAQGVDGIVAIPWDYEAVLSDIERSHEAGIPFVTVDQAPADTSTVDFHSGADPYADGLHAGQRLVALVGDEPCKVVDLQGALSHFNGQMRDKGFKDGIADKPNIEIISEVPTEWRPEPVLAGMENALQAHPDLCAVFAASDGFLPPIWSALEKVDRYKTVDEEGHVYVLSVDGDPQGCSSVKDGYMDAGYAQPVPKMTRDSFLKIIDMVNGVEIPEEERIQFIAGTEYTLENIDETASQVWGCIE
jgi:ABC-type sugar transport system substrate-binding protein